MSSILRKYSQIPPRVKYLSVASAATAVDAGATNLVSGFSLAPGEHIELSSIATNADVAVAAGYAVIAAGDYVDGALYKDMGRQITIYDPVDHKHLAVFRQVQMVDGVGTEGVGVEGVNPESYYANLYLKVWSADGMGVVVVRTG